LEIERKEVVLPKISPPLVYMHEDQRDRFVSRVYADPERAAIVKNPLKPGMTFKQ